MNFDELANYKKLLRQASVPNVALDAQRALQYAYTAGSRRCMEQLLENMRQPIITAATNDLLALQDVTKQLAPLSEYRLPAAVYRPRIDLGEDAIRAAIEAARSAQADALRRIGEEAINAVTVKWPTEALASAQYTSVHRMLGNPPWQEALRELGRASIANIQTQYAETMRQATRLLSDETVRRMVELAESTQMLQQGARAADEADTLFEDLDTWEDVEPEALDPSSPIDTLLPFVRWAILILSIAAITAASDPTFAEYREPLNDTVSKLVLLERALDLCRKRDKDDRIS